MVEDPYKVLGVSENASKEEIKKAYRKKAKEYHPDLHPDDPVAAQKMNEVNEAYDMLNNPEKYKKQNTGRSTAGNNPYGNPYGGAYGNSYGNGQYYGDNQRGQGSYGTGGYGSYDDWFGFGRSEREAFHARSQAGDSELIRQAVDLINSKAYSYALQSLNYVVSSQRNARWYYLSALANYGQGNEMLALSQIQKAVQMEPENAEYRSVLQKMQRSSGSYDQAGQEFQRYAEGMGTFCGSLFMLQFCLMFCRCC
ncbi:MAG: DnaJ domain-containing protein [Muricoprocola sp.]